MSHKNKKDRSYKTGHALALSKEQTANNAFVELNGQLQKRVYLLEKIVGKAIKFTDGLFDPPYARDAGGIKFLRDDLIASYELLETPKKQDPILKRRR